MNSWAESESESDVCRLKHENEYSLLHLTFPFGLLHDSRIILATQISVNAEWYRKQNFNYKKI
jgi:hypothetical protein